MRVLAIDTALAACSVCVLDTGADRALSSHTHAMPRGHAEALMPMIAAAMADAGCDYAGLDGIAVTVGPGSFTGLRVGIAAARGIALAAGKPAVGVTTLAALAAPLIAADHGTAVLAAIDARHAFVYVQAFAPGGAPSGSPRIAEAAEAAREAASAQTRIVGSGAGLLARAWPADARPAVGLHEIGAPDILWVARLGAALPSAIPPVPLYLRPPDARPQNAASLPRR